MRFVRLQLVNFCQHERLDWVLCPQLNLVRGPNGAGKTNILRALQFALTGDAGGFCNKDENRRFGAAKRDEASVQLTLEHGGQLFTVRRQLPTGAELTLPDGQVVRGITEVTTQLLERLDLTKRQIENYVFVHQRCLDALIDKSPTERAVELAQLFRLERASSIYNGIGDFLRNIEVPTPGVSEEEAQRQLASAEQAYAAAEREFQSHPGVSEDLAAKLQWYQQQLMLADRRDREVQEWSRLDNRLEALRSEREGLQQAQTALEGRVQALLQQKALLEPQEATAQEVLAAWERYDERLQSYLTYVHDCEQVKEAFRKRPDIPEQYGISEVHVQQLESQKHRVGEWQTHVAAELSRVQAALETRICYACKQTLPNLAELEQQKEALEQQALEISQKYAQLSAELKLRCAQAKRNQEVYAQRSCLRAEVRRLRQHRVAAPAPPEQSRESVAQAHADYVEVEKQLHQATVTLAQYAQQHQGLVAIQQEFAERLQQVQQQLNELPDYSIGQRQEFQEQQRQLQHQQQAYMVLYGRWTAARATLEASRNQLQQTRKILRDAQGIRSAVEHLQQVRQIFHPSAAPYVVSRTRLEEQERKVNELLQLFEAPFSVQPDETMGFTATFPDTDKQMRDQRLSVGERGILSLCFRIAVNSTFAESLGLLIMDEPTAGWDAHNLRRFPLGLSRLRELSGKMGLQVIIVSHDEELTPYFDSVLELA